MKITIYTCNSIGEVSVLQGTKFQQFNSYREAHNYLIEKGIPYKPRLKDLLRVGKPGVVASRLDLEDAQIKYGKNNGYSIYQKTNCSSGLKLFPYTKEYQFKSYKDADRYLDLKSYNGSATIITNLSLASAKDEYCD